MNQDELIREIQQLKKRVAELEHTVKLLKSLMHPPRTDYRVRAIGKPLTKKLDIPVVED